MALTEQQIQHFKARFAPTSDEPQDIDTKIKNIVSGVSNEIESGGFMTDIKGIGSDIAESYSKTSGKVGEIAQSDVGLGRKLFQGLGQAAGFVSSGIGSIFTGGVKALTPEAIQKPAGEAITSVAQKVVEAEPVKNMLNWYSNLPPEQQRDVDSVLGISSLALDVAGVGLGAKGVKAGAKVGMEAVETGAKAVAKTYEPVISKGMQVAKESISPTVSPEKALGEVLQGAEKTVSKETLEAVATLPTEKVKTFKDLDKVITKKVDELAKKVDTDLDADPTPIKLKDLTTTKTTSGGQAVKANYVEQAINHLEEAYGASGDLVGAKEMKELLQRAKKTGLSRKEVNNLARKYGSEFKSKAFGKTGEPLTSVNAKLYETVRTELKGVARAGIKGGEAQLADKTMGRLLNTQTLIKKNIEAVNKLTQKIKERGLFEKIGHAVGKYGDILSGGSIRGIVGGILPRGAGYKTMNALDLEEVLAKNLKIIRDAGKAKTTKQFESIINGLGQ